MFRFFISVCILFLIWSCGKPPERADLILHHAKIYTVDSSFKIEEAIAIRDGKILAVGKNEEILRKFTSDSIKDLAGKIIFPGFIDAHCHFVNYGLGLERADLVGTQSFEEVISKVVQFANDLNLKDANSLPSPQAAEGPGLRKERSWIVGRGWDQNDWADKNFPTNEKLDSIFPDQPVILKRIDGHAALANSFALSLAGVTNETKVSGGEILSKDKRLTGILIDNAVDLVEKIIPEPDGLKLKRALLNAQKNCFEVGLTTVDDAGLLKKEIDVIDELQKSGELKMRVYAMLSDSHPNYQHYFKEGHYKTDRLNVRSFKFYADGALGSRGACLLHDYSDKKDWKGFLLRNPEHYEKAAKQMKEKNFQMNTHCIGDSSFHMLMEACSDINSSKENRWRIEHAQVVSKADLEAIKKNGIIPSVQPTHATSDMYWAEERLGKERVKTAYAYKDLLQAAGILALGTDFPVEDISPFKTFYAAVARKDSRGFPAKGYQMENALSREETLRGMTIWAAYSNFEEHEKGSLEKGKFADFIILDTDLMTCEEEKILDAKVKSTYISGEKVFGKL